MTEILIPPRPGEIFRLRQRQYLVEGVTPASNPDDSPVASVTCLEDDPRGQSLEVLWEREIDPEIISGEAWQDIAERGFDPPNLSARMICWPGLKYSEGCNPCPS